MAEPNPKRSRKRSRVAKGEDFQVQHLAETTDLSPNQARELLRRHGDDWRKIDEAAKVFKAESQRNGRLTFPSTGPMPKCKVVTRKGGRSVIFGHLESGVCQCNKLPAATRGGTSALMKRAPRSKTVERGDSEGVTVRLPLHAPIVTNDLAKNRA